MCPIKGLLNALGGRVQWIEYEPWTKRDILAHRYDRAR